MVLLFPHLLYLKDLSCLGKSYCFLYFPHHENPVWDIVIFKFSFSGFNCLDFRKLCYPNKSICGISFILLKTFSTCTSLSGTPKSHSRSLERTLLNCTVSLSPTMHCDYICNVATTFIHSSLDNGSSVQNKDL